MAKKIFLEKIKPKIKKIAKKYDLNFVALFGSRASGLVHKRSDIDLAYSAKKFLDYRKEYELTCEFQRAFKLFVEAKTSFRLA